MTPLHPQSIVILDFGGQYAHLIGNRIRRLGAYSEIREPEIDPEELRGAAGIILSGGPQSVYDKGSPQADRGIFDLGIPILGICYGHQWIAHMLGGEVKPGRTKEYGPAEVECSSLDSVLFQGLPKKLRVWMSHGDAVTKLPNGFITTSSSLDCTVAAMENPERKIFGVQFHLEVTHTPQGMEILKHFLDLCDHAIWSVEDFSSHIGEQVKKEVGDRKVFMLISGGVDSTVAFTLLNRVLGKDRVYGLLIDTGLMRKNEVQEIRGALSALGFTNLHVEDASALFIERLKNVYDPEEKRRVIGQTFLDIQREVAKRLKVDGPEWILGQGTIYPDTIETGGTIHADKIKTHHNRIEEIQKMIEEGRVIEPLKDLYKDEVRQLGALLGLPHKLISRHPFPGPGLGVRILCAKREMWPDHWQENHEEITGGIQVTISTLSSPYAIRVLPIRSVGVQGDSRTYRHAVALFSHAPCRVTDAYWKLATEIPNKHPEFNRVLLCTSHTIPPKFVFVPTYITENVSNLAREADAIVHEEMEQKKLYEDIWQFPTVLLPIGTSDGQRSVVLRPVASQEAMTANAFHLPEDFLKAATEKLLTLKGIDMVFYDLTSKPPATIEWE